MTDMLDRDYESDITEEEHERLVLMSEHAIAKSLSPAARSVFEAFNSKFDWVEDGVPGPQFEAIAAALRAAVRQALPKVNTGADRAPFSPINDIAAELEAQ